MDATLTAPAWELIAWRQILLAKIASRERDTPHGAKPIASKRVEAFCRTMRATLLDETSEVGKRYLRFLVDEIRVEGKTAVLWGSYAALAHTVRTLSPESKGVVPTPGPESVPPTDSNPAAGGVYSIRTRP